MVKHIHPVGSCAQGRQDLNPRRAALETAVLPLNYVPR
jgi:hypothetical protein